MGPSLVTMRPHGESPVGRFDLCHRIRIREIEDPQPFKIALFRADSPLSVACCEEQRIIDIGTDGNECISVPLESAAAEAEGRCGVVEPHTGGALRVICASLHIDRLGRLSGDTVPHRVPALCRIVPVISIEESQSLGHRIRPRLPPLCGSSPVPHHSAVVVSGVSGQQFGGNGSSVNSQIEIPNFAQLEFPRSDVRILGQSSL